MPVADRAGDDLALADAVGVEKRLQGLEDQQGRAAVSLALLGGLDDVVWGYRDTHG